jgi:hypothetical protein
MYDPPTENLTLINYPAAPQAGFPLRYNKRVGYEKGIDYFWSPSP